MQVKSSIASKWVIVIDATVNNQSGRILPQILRTFQIAQSGQILHELVRYSAARVYHTGTGAIIATVFLSPHNSLIFGHIRSTVNHSFKVR